MPETASPLPPDVAAEVRSVVSEVLREVLAETRLRREAGAPAPAAPTRDEGVVEPTPGRRTETVRITGDDDLQAFALRLLAAYENPRVREDLRHGRVRFALTGGVAAAAAPGAVHRVERGAVTERVVAAVAREGSRLVLGPRAVMTPLARERARVLQVPVEKERP